MTGISPRWPSSRRRATCSKPYSSSVPTGPRFPGSAVRLPWTRQPCACCGAFPPHGRISPADRSLVRRSTTRTACWIAPSPALKPEPPDLPLFQQNPIRIPRSAGRCRVRSTRWLRKGCSNGPSRRRAMPAATSPAILWNCPPMPRRIAACAFRRWPAPTKGFCSAWPTPRSAASALCIPSPENCAGDGWKCPFSPKSSALMSLSAKSS